MHVPPIAFGLLALLAACSTEATSQVAASATKNVVLICLDTVRADHMGFNGYDRRATTPRLDQLAARSVVFRDASASACWTKPSVPSYMTGTPPAVHGVYEGSARGLTGVSSDVLGPEAVTLAEVFAERGYRTGAFVQNAQLRLGMGLEQGFDSYVDGAGRADAIRWQGQDWLSENATGEQPFFLYLHFLDAHWPYPVPDEYATLWASREAIAPYRDGDSRALRDAINDGDVPFGEAEREALVALYDGSLRYLDDQLGLLFEDLERRGLADDTVIAVISDHGEEFGEHGRIGHGHGLSEGLLRVPFVLHVPGDPDLAGLVVDEPVSLLDLFPTLVRAAGLHGPNTGRPVDLARDRLWDPAAPGEAPPIYAEHKAPDRYLQSLRVTDTQLLRSLRPSEAELLPPFELGRRYEAEFERDGDLWVATQLKPRDEDPDDAPELKGPLVGLRTLDDGRAAFEIAGLAIEAQPAAQFTLAEGAEASDGADGGAALAEGRMVKVRGPLQDGVLRAERIKVYGPDTEPGLELRATLTALADDRLGFGDLAVALLETTRLKGLEGARRKRRMSAEQVLAAHTGDLHGLELEQRLIGLTGLEAAPGPDTDERLEAWSERLESDFATWAARRGLGGTTRRVLTEDELADLAAIGYTDE